MRKTIAIVLLGLFALAVAEKHNNQYGKEYKVAEKLFLKKQMDVLRLLKYVFQRSCFYDQVKIAKFYHIEKHLNCYRNPKVVTEFLYFWKKGMLPRGEVFSVFNKQHKDELVALFKVLYNAKDWDTFYKTACWARENVNEGMFVFAIYAAVFHRHDTRGMVLPPIYEIFPYFFVNSEAIAKAYRFKMKYGNNQKEDEQIYYVNANYSGWYLNANPSTTDLSYFHEDIGFNAYYFIYTMDYPLLLEDTLGSRSLFYLISMQMLAREYLEKLSQRDCNIPFDDEGPCFEYVPKTTDSTNKRFNGIIQMMDKQLLDYNPRPLDEYMLSRTTKEHFGPCICDPIFYFYNKFTYYFLKYKSNLSYYTYSELNYPGVKIKDVSFSKLETYFDKFDWEITNALYVNEYEFNHDSFHVRAHQYRLNHKAFTFKMQVASDTGHDVMVKVFLGPKYDEQGHVMTIKENWQNFVQFDQFPWHLKAGNNVIERHSDGIKDRPSFRKLYKHVMAALKGKEEFYIDMTEAHNGFPNRLILPKGKVDGQEYQFFYYIGPYVPAAKKSMYDKVYSAGLGGGHRYLDGRPFGYPLDRPVEREDTFSLPNAYLKKVVIYHKQ